LKFKRNRTPILKEVKMNIKINKPKNTDLKSNTAWMNSPIQSDQNDGEQNSGSTPTISVKITSGKRSEKEMEGAIEKVINKNKELYKRLAE